MDFSKIAAAITQAAQAAQAAQLQAVLGATGFPFGGIFGFPQPTATGPSQQEQELQAIANDLNTSQQQFQSLELTLQQNAPAAATSINSAMDAALASLFKLAVMLRGDFDPFKADTTQEQSLLDTVLARFQDVETQTETAFNGLSTIHQQAADLKSTKVDPIKDRIGGLSNELATRIAGLEQSTTDAQNNINHLNQTLQQAHDNMNTLQERKASAEQAATAANVGLGIATLGIWNLAGAIDSSKTPSAVIGLNDQINGLQNQINDLNGQLFRASMGLQNLQTQLAQSRHDELVQQQVQAQLPPLSTSADGLITKIAAMEQQLATLKDTAAQLVMRTSMLRDKATAAAHEDFSKDEFALDILQICALASIDAPRATEARDIKNDLVNNYTGTIPDDVKGAVDALTKALTALGVQ